MSKHTDPRVVAVRKKNAAFKQFSRNGRWGTCVDCPRDSSEDAYPEFCTNTERSDHQLTIDALAEGFTRELLLVLSK